MGAAVRPGDGFVLWTPLLPAATVDDLLAGLAATPDGWDDEKVAADVATLTRRVLDLVADPVVREALYVASPSLVAALDRAGDDAAHLLRPLLAYLTRLCLRPTPFGLFAGSSVGTIGAGSLTLAPRAAYRKVSRLDFGYLAGLVARAEADPAVRGALTFVPSSGLYRGGGRLRFPERRGGTVRLVAVQEDEALATVLAAARDGAPLDALAATLVDDEVTPDDARAYVAELVDAQLLVSDLGPRLTGPDAGRDLAARLPGGAALAAAVDGLAALDAAGLGAGVAAYEAIVATVAATPGVTAERLVQVDLVKPGAGLALSPAVAAEVARVAGLLHRLYPESGDDDVTVFAAAFARRFGDREVPLGVALDEDLGVGFGPVAENAPLLAGLGAVPDPGWAAWRPRDAYLLGLVQDGGAEIRLTDADLAALASTRPAPLPDALTAVVTVVGGPDFDVLFHKAAGPSGAQVVGRFCHLDPALEELVRGHLREEEAHRPDAVFAEIVHLPHGRAGNVLARPVLRAYEIPFLGGSGAPPEARIPLDDLLVSVRDGRVVLRSARLGREVLPRLTSAHHFPGAALAAYRFLASLQHQGRSIGLYWRWGPLADAPFLPRVVHGRTVLDRARWRLTVGDLADVRAATTPAARYAAVQRLRDTRGLPHRLVVAEGDSELDVDLGSVAGTELFAHAARRGGPVTVLERFPEPAAVTGPEGAYANYVVVPLTVDAPPAAPPGAPAAPAALAARPAGEAFLPGSEWLDVTFDASAASGDVVLRGLVAPVAAAADRWFFERTAGGVRVRLHGDAPRLLDLVRDAAAPYVADDTLADVRVGTYRREAATFGGPEGGLVAEAVAAADSAAVLDLLRVADGTDRWRLALAGLHRLYATLAPGEPLARARRDALLAGLGANGVAARRLAGRRFRAERHVLAPLLAGRTEEPRLRAGLAVLDARDAALRAAAAELDALAAAGRLTRPVGEVATEHGRRFVDRLLRGSPRLQELVLCDLLDRLGSVPGAAPR
jgi:thiopeptide-type bacteriocin biosynthesis protein